VRSLQARCGPEGGRGITLLFCDRGTRGWGVFSSTPRPHFTPGKDPVLILQEAGWAPGPVWTGGKSRRHRDPIPDCPACNQSLYLLSYPAHTLCNMKEKINLQQQNFEICQFLTSSLITRWSEVSWKFFFSFKYLFTQYIKKNAHPLFYPY